MLAQPVARAADAGRLAVGVGRVVDMPKGQSRPSGRRACRRVFAQTLWVRSVAATDEWVVVGWERKPIDPPWW